MKKRLKRGLKEIGRWCKQNRHEPVSKQQETLNAKLRGHYLSVTPHFDYPSYEASSILASAGRPC